MMVSLVDMNGIFYNNFTLFCLGLEHTHPDLKENYVSCLCGQQLCTLYNYVVYVCMYVLYVHVCTVCMYMYVLCSVCVYVHVCTCMHYVVYVCMYVHYIVHVCMYVHVCIM